jgi:hypothetical protein
MPKKKLKRGIVTLKNKVIGALALVLCMGAFFMPAKAYAAADSTPPTVTARITGEVLRIEATDADTGVEAVFINGIRFNYRVDGALDIPARDNAGAGENITVYAVDFAGNKSDTVLIANPYYTPPTPTTVPAQNTADTSIPPAEPPAPGKTPEPSEEPPTSESAIPSKPLVGKALTPDGTGTVLDDIVEQNGKEFFSITTDAGNVFYLIVDRQRNSENVYLLNAVTEDDLMALAEKSNGGNKSVSAVPTPPTPTETPLPPSETEKPVEEQPDAGGGNNGLMIFLVLAVIAIGGAGYYIKIVKPKQQAASDMDDDDDEQENNTGDNDYDFEDEPEKSADSDDEDGGDESGDDKEYENDPGDE